MSIDADFTYIDGLEVANPTTGDPRSAGDDHLRGIKTAVKGTFPNIGAAAVTATAAELNYCDVTAGQVANDKAMVPTGSALDCNSIAFTEVNIDTGNIAAAVVLADGIAATTQSPTDGTTALATCAYADAQAALRLSWSYLATFNASAATLGSTDAIPSTATMIRLLFFEASVNATTDSADAAIKIFLGHSSGTYDGTVSGVVGTGTTNELFTSSGYSVTRGANAAAAATFVGEITFSVANGGLIWMGNGHIGNSASAATVHQHSAGSTTLSAALTSVKVEVASGAFDGGSVQVLVYS